MRVIELAGIGPAPFCAMLLADLGADVIRVERSGDHTSARPVDPLLRNRRSIALDLKCAAAIEAVLALIAKAEILIEGFRPGVAERLGLGPEQCHAANSRLVYGRMTGWGQDGPLAQTAGHDINYIALAGALHMIGPRGGKPVPPLNLVGDFGGGGMLLAFGVLAALTEARRSGRGQVVDASMLDGTIALLAMSFWFRAQGWLHEAPGEMFLAGGAPYYDTYRTQDGKFVAIGAIEPQFFGELLDKLGLDRKRYASLGFPTVDPATPGWGELREAISKVIAARTRDEWCRIFEGSDACVTPVLTLAEAARHPHNAARGAFIDVDGIEQGAPVPRFSRTRPAAVRPPRTSGEDTLAVLHEAGFSDERIEALRAAGAFG